jgi:hypothetical protein
MPWRITGRKCLAEKWSDIRIKFGNSEVGLIKRVETDSWVSWRVSAEILLWLRNIRDAAERRGIVDSGFFVRELLQPRDCIVQIGVLHFPELRAQHALITTPLCFAYYFRSKDGISGPIPQHKLL